MHWQRSEMLCPYTTWKHRAHFGGCSWWKRSPVHQGRPDHRGCVAHLGKEGCLLIAVISLLHLCNRSHCLGSGNKRFPFCALSFCYLHIKRGTVSAGSSFFKKANFRNHILSVWLSCIWFHDSAMYISHLLVNLHGWVWTLSQAQICLLYVFFCFALRTKWFVGSHIDPG